MLAHYHGHMLNASKIGQSLGFSSPTIRGYLDIMAQTFMVRVLPPFHANIKKRLIKSPKVYLRDSGILHALLEIEELEDLLGHPVVGNSWEGWCMEQIISMMPQWRPCFYRTSSGEEIDLVLERGRRWLAFEFKASMAPKVSRGFPGSIEILQPEQTWIIAPVGDSYSLMAGVEVTNIGAVLSRLSRDFM